MPASILIIDDDEDIRFTLEEICQSGGFVVESASRGSDGLTRILGGAFDLVIVDYHMPEWDGLTTVKRIREINQEIGILVLTVDERQEIADRFMAAGATDFALKPIKAVDLLSRIRLNLSIVSMHRSLQAKHEQVFLEKGISSATLSLFTAYFQSTPEPVQLEAVVKAVGFAYQTTHRYIQYMVEQGLLIVEPLYGQLGRPKNTYRYNQA